MLQERVVGEGRFTAQAEDRRRSHREPVVTVGQLRTGNDPKEPGKQVLVSDVSLHGVGLRATFELPMGDFFTIEIGVGPLHLASRMRVVRVRALKDGTYDIGGEFC